jgi:hypothetical protein
MGAFTRRADEVLGRPHNEWEAAMILQYMAVAVTLTALGVLVSATRSNQYPTLNTAPVCHGITDRSDLQEGLRNVTFDQRVQAEQVLCSG